MRPRTAVLAPRGRRVRAAFDRPLSRGFYDRPTERVAEALLGRWVVRRDGRAYRCGRIVETEAYVSGDLANHAAFGPTMRNRSMFGPPGTLYVYRIHQVHCANAVTRPGEAVLLRAIEPVHGLLGDSRGPGRLCRALAVDRADDGSDLIVGAVRILGGEAPRERIVRGPRIGIRRDADRPLRFRLFGNPWVSRPRSPGRPPA